MKFLRKYVILIVVSHQIIGGVITDTIKEYFKLPPAELLKAGDELISAGNTELALSCYGTAAERGMPDAYLRIADCFHNGIGLEKNESGYFRWIRQYIAVAETIRPEDIAPLDGMADHYYTLVSNGFLAESEVARLSSELAGAQETLRDLENRTRGKNRYRARISETADTIASLEEKLVQQKSALDGKRYVADAVNAYEAMRIYRERMKDDKTALVYDRLGDLYEFQGDIEASVHAYEHGKKNAKTLWKIGRFYRAHGNYEAAKEAFSAGMKFDDLACKIQYSLLSGNGELLRECIEDPDLTKHAEAGEVLWEAAKYLAGFHTEVYLEQAKNCLLRLRVLRGSSLDFEAAALYNDIRAEMKEIRKSKHVGLFARLFKK